MGQLVKGQWQNEWYEADEKGHFVRPDTQFHCDVSNAASAVITAEADRYHLYISLACPWAHRTLIMRKLKKLEHAISLSVVDHFMGDHGWVFTNNPGCIPEIGRASCRERV